ncbi:dienelactone hydrolase family protein [Pseudonocardia kongjuensis]|uniref:Dienelactone hydrolase family protein n=1 Tax=Pseudonocardia kongjuensis TaxID=102227 RepID=A0ABP4ICZ3_9PSEU
MARVVVFHHAQGLTDGIRSFADELRADGHDVTVPDLYDGATFDSLDAGVAHAERIGFGTLVGRGRDAVDGGPAEVVYLGFSLGVLPAQMLAQTRPGAQGALLCHSCIPTAEFDVPWPQGVPVQIHAMGGDELFRSDGDLDAARDIVASNDDAELFLYPGDRHLFTDSSLAAYDRDAAALLNRRVRAFLAGIG